LDVSYAERSWKNFTLCNITSFLRGWSENVIEKKNDVLFIVARAMKAAKNWTLKLMVALQLSIRTSKLI